MAPMECQYACQEARRGVQSYRLMKKNAQAGIVNLLTILPEP
jgi:hypothetical protein